MAEIEIDGKPRWYVNLTCAACVRTDAATKRAVLDRLAYAMVLAEHGLQREALACLREAIDVWAGRVSA